MKNNNSEKEDVVEDILNQVLILTSLTFILYQIYSFEGNWFYLEPLKRGVYEPTPDAPVFKTLVGAFIIPILVKILVEHQIPKIARYLIKKKWLWKNPILSTTFLLILVVISNKLTFTRHARFARHYFASIICSLVPSGAR